MVVRFGIGGMVFAIAISLWGNFHYRKQRKVTKEDGKGIPWWSTGYWFYLVKKRILMKVGIWESEKAYYQEIFVNQNPEVEQTKEACRQGIAIAGILFGTGLLLCSLSGAGVFSPKPVAALTRPESGTSTSSLLAEVEDSTYEVAVAVQERQLSAAEIEETWRSAKDNLPEWILGENESINQVNHDLCLITQIPGTPVQVSWYSSDYTLINYEGKVNTGALVELSQLVKLTAELDYGNWSESITIPVYVTAQKLTVDEQSQKSIEDALEESMVEQLHSEEVQLPKEVDEEPVVFYQKPEQTPIVFVGFALVLLAGVFSVAKSKQRKQKEERYRQLKLDYPELVSKLTLLMEAGMTIRLSWEKIIEDYLRYSGKRHRYAYEEMLTTKNQMLVGVPEAIAYEEFGKRCGSILYLRFSSVLVQNLNKGTKSILPLLKKEAEEARLERKEHAKQLGEEAGTKLLVPMAGMLILVLAVVMIPAFMSF